MATKAKGSSRAAAPAPEVEVPLSPWPPSPWVHPALTTEERLQYIEALGQRIAGNVRFMFQVGGLKGTSAETKERAVTAFHERMTLLESRWDAFRKTFGLADRRWRA